MLMNEFSGRFIPLDRTVRFRRKKIMLKYVVLLLLALVLTGC